MKKDCRSFLKGKRKSKGIHEVDAASQNGQPEAHVEPVEAQKPQLAAAASARPEWIFSLELPLPSSFVGGRCGEGEP